MCKTQRVECSFNRDRINGLACDASMILMTFSLPRYLHITLPIPCMLMAQHTQDGRDTAVGHQRLLCLLTTLLMIEVSTSASV